jgi:hypothetical protein
LELLRTGYVCVRKCVSSCTCNSGANEETALGPNKNNSRRNCTHAICASQMGEKSRKNSGVAYLLGDLEGLLSTRDRLDEVLALSNGGLVTLGGGILPLVN